MRIGCIFPHDQQRLPSRCRRTFSRLACKETLPQTSARWLQRMHLPSISRTTKSWCGHYWEIVGGMIQDTGRAFHEQLICTQRTSTREHLNTVSSWKCARAFRHNVVVLASRMHSRIMVKNRTPLTPLIYMVLFLSVILGWGWRLVFLGFWLQCFIRKNVSKFWSEPLCWKLLYFHFNTICEWKFSCFNNWITRTILNQMFAEESGNRNYSREF